MIRTINKLMTISVVTSCILSLPGCAVKQYVQETDSNEFSTLIITSNSNSETLVNAYDNSECNISEGFGRIADVFPGKSSRVKVAAGKKMFLALIGTTSETTYTYNSTTITNYKCTNLIELTPDAGEEYIVSQEYNRIGNGSICKPVVVSGKHKNIIEAYSINKPHNNCNKRNHF